MIISKYIIVLLTDLALSSYDDIQEKLEYHAKEEDSKIYTLRLDFFDQFNTRC